MRGGPTWENYIYALLPACTTALRCLYLRPHGLPFTAYRRARTFAGELVSSGRTEHRASDVVSYGAYGLRGGSVTWCSWYSCQPTPGYRRRCQELRAHLPHPFPGGWWRLMGVCW